jgi:predicted metal-dependent peptidase
MGTKIEDELRELGIAYGWTNPFFLAPLANIDIKEDPGVATMRVNIDGKVSVNPDFYRRLTDSQKAGVLFHEVMHLMMMHAMRQEGRTQLVQTADGQVVSLFNVAADMAINHVLKQMRIQLPEGALYPPHEYTEMNTEQIYDELAKKLKNEGPGGVVAVMSPGKGRKGQQQPQDGQQGEPQVGAGCGVDPGEGGQDSEDKSKPDPHEKWEQVAAQARALAAGTEAGDLLAKLFTRRESLRWERLIRASFSRARAQHGRDEQTWTRRSRRMLPSDPDRRISLPGWKATKATGCVVFDISGSMSDEQVSRSVDQAQRIAEIAEARVWVVVHDAQVQFSGWLNGRSRAEYQKVFRGRGGTDFRPAYEAVERSGQKFDFMVHTTDGECYGDWPDKPSNCKRLIVALVGECSPSQMPGCATSVRVTME